MKLDKVVSSALTEEEFEALKEKMIEAIRQTGNIVSVSAFIREHVIKPYLNGSQPEPPTKDARDSISKEFDDINF